ncbi:MAG: hypothetical protein LBE86_14125 [Gemmobacter sp.]|jgi:hypothetical protein|nr:hypothetical protein [Gemmobacter sp.]
MRPILLPLMILSPLVLAACGPSVPDSGAGVGYGGYGNYEAQREAALGTGAPMVAAGAQPIVPGGVAAQPIGAVPPASGFSTERLGAAIDRASGAMPPVADAGGVVVGEPIPAPIPMAPPVTAQPEASAVPLAPTMPVVVPVPMPGGKGGPNVVQFALSTSHPVGTAMYPRSSIRLQSPDRACAGYASADMAQMAFLEAGGPEKDRKGLDPDGDGYACSWDPSGFRAAVQ